jgi:hypothetical protein
VAHSFTQTFCSETGFPSKPDEASPQAVFGLDEDDAAGLWTNS